MTDMTSTDTPSASQSFIEHVLLCIRVSVEGRGGVVLLDPGYHVPRPITVMEDGLPPHSGPVLTAATRTDVTKSFSYYFLPTSKLYVVWEAEERRGLGKKKLTKNLIHVARPYLSSVDVTERRNLAYTFKSLIGRNTKGDFTGGLYFVVKPPPTPPPHPLSSSSSEMPAFSSESSLSSSISCTTSTSLSSSSTTTITFFHKVNSDMKFVKKSLAYFLPLEDPEHDKEEDKWKDEQETDKEQKNKIKIDEEVEEVVCKVGTAVGRSGGKLRNTLSTLSGLLHDQTFLSDLLDLEDALKALGDP